MECSLWYIVKEFKGLNSHILLVHYLTPPISFSKKSYKLINFSRIRGACIVLYRSWMLSSAYKQVFFLHNSWKQNVCIKGIHANNLHATCLYHKSLKFLASGMFLLLFYELVQGGSPRVWCVPCRNLHILLSTNVNMTIKQIDQFASTETHTFQSKSVPQTATANCLQLGNRRL